MPDLRTAVDNEVWVTMKGFSVRIYPTDEGVVTDIWDAAQLAQGQADECLASTYAFESDLGTYAEQI